MKFWIIAFAVVGIVYGKPQFAKYERLKIGDPNKQVNIGVPVVITPVANTGGGSGGRIGSSSGGAGPGSTGAGGRGGIGTGGGVGGIAGTGGGDGIGLGGRPGVGSGTDSIRGSGVGSGLDRGGSIASRGSIASSAGLGSGGGRPDNRGGAGRFGSGGNLGTRSDVVQLGDPNADYIRIIYQSLNQVDDGSYAWRYETENGINAQEKGTVINPGQETQSLAANGYYSFVAPDNVKYEVYYLADENGFQATGDHLPTPHPIPDYIQRALEWNAAHPEEEDEQK